MVTRNDIYIRDVDASVADDTGRVGYYNGSLRNIYLQGVKISYDVGIFLQVGQQPAKAVTGAFNTKLAYGDFLGFGNPEIVVDGVINLNDYDTSTGDAPLSGTDLVMSVKLLQQIFRSGHVFSLTDIFDSGPTSPIYRIHTLSGEFLAETIDVPKVMCSGVHIETDTETEEGAKITYRITFREVKV